MEVYFNELSLEDHVSTMKYEDIYQLKKLYTGLRDFNIQVCRISPEDYRRILELIESLPTANNIKNFIYSFFRTPYETNEEIEAHSDEYLSHSWYYGSKQCFGLAWSYILASMSLSIFSDEWNHEYVHIAKDGEQVHVRHFCREEHLQQHMPWYISLKNPCLEICSITPEKKEISLRDDHGKDVLKAFSKKLCQSPYVCEIINSLPYNAHSHHFIKRVRENGLIEIVLIWTDEGLGLVVKTTGRNIKETEQISKLLEEQYGSA